MSGPNVDKLYYFLICKLDGDPLVQPGMSLAFLYKIWCKKPEKEIICQKHLRKRKKNEGMYVTRIGALEKKIKKKLVIHPCCNHVGSANKKKQVG